jgi:hypothetical protein
MGQKDTRKPRDFKLKLEAGNKYRIAFPWVEDGQVQIEEVAFYRRFDEDPIPDSKKIKTTFRVPEGGLQPKSLEAEALRICGKPKIRYVTPVLVYATNAEGKVTESMVGAYDIRLWQFADKTLSQLKSINDETPLVDIDIQVFCEDKYYNVQCTPKQGTALYKSEKYQSRFDIEKIKTEAEELAKQATDSVAIVLSTDQIIAALKLDRKAFIDEYSDDDIGLDEPVGVGVEAGSETVLDDDMPF